MSYKFVQAGDGPFPENRSTRAAMLFARYWCREGLMPELERIVAADSDMRKTDYLVGRILGWKKGMRVIGVVCEGFGIVDTSGGQGNVAIQNQCALARAGSAHRRVIRELEDLDIPNHPV